MRRTADHRRVREAIRTSIDEGRDTQEFAADEARGHSDQTIIALEHVYLSFDQPILEDVSFGAHAGETIVVVGESGTGKSTTLKLILRLLVPDQGRVYIDGEDITHLTFTDALNVRQKMGMVFQGAALFDSMTVFENVAYPLREHTELRKTRSSSACARS